MAHYYQSIGKISVHGNKVVWKVPVFLLLRKDHSKSVLYSRRFSIGNISWKLSAMLGNNLMICVTPANNIESQLKLRFGIKGKDKEDSSSSTLSIKKAICCKFMDCNEIIKNTFMWTIRDKFNIFFTIENLREAHELSSQTITNSDLRKLQKDFEFLAEGNASDIVVKIEDKEIPCHRCILAARSPVFLAMMTHETKEKATGIIEIKDADPDIFHDFLYYLYTGRVRNMSEGNVLHLYMISDMYQVEELKNNCRKYISETISVENFCDILELSLLHNDKKLIKECHGFFQMDYNSLKIMKRSKWQSFMIKNPVACNKILINLLEDILYY